MRESFTNAYAAAFGMLRGYLDSAAHDLAHPALVEDGIQTVRQAVDFARIFSTMTPDEKAAWDENGHPLLQSPAPVTTSTPLPGLVPAGEIDAALGRVAGL